MANTFRIMSGQNGKFAAAASESATARAVLERRADAAAQCECLAAWDSGRDCICNKHIEVPLSIEKLKLAERIVRQIESNDRRRGQLESLEGDVIDCSVGDTGDRRHVINGDVHTFPGSCISIPIPKKLLLNALRQERDHLLTSLVETGIVSVDRGNIRSSPA